MIRRTRELSPPALGRFDAILDVRSPGEFALDHLPGAVSLPALSDEERAEVGTIYVQQSHFEARRLGAAYVAANIARHLRKALNGHGAGFRPLVYCWRGGMRSNAVATVFEQIGWQTTLVEGGYRTWRRQVVAALYDGPPLSHRLLLLDGPTGVGKTELLEALAGRGEQVLDLEALAGHQGSLFGAVPGGQPAQKLFETRLLDALSRFDPGWPVFAEAESSRIGALTLPPVLWAAMERAPRLCLRAPAAWRVAHILGRYRWIAADRQALVEAVGRLPSHHARRRKEEWQALALAGDFAPLVEGLIREHYDPAYARSRGARGGAILGTIGRSGDVSLDAGAVISRARQAFGQ